MLTTPMDVLTRFPVRKTKQQKQQFRDAVQFYATKLGYTTAVETGRFGCRNLVIGDPDRASCLVTAHYDTCARMWLPNLITPCNLLCFVGYQLLLTLSLTVPPMLIGVCLALLTGEPILIGLCTYWGIFVMLALMIFGPANPTNANDNTSGVVTLLEIARSLPETQREKVCFVLFDLEEPGLIGSASYRKAHKAASARQIVLNLDCVGDGDQIRLFPTKALTKDRRKLTSLYKACGYFGKKSIVVVEKGFCIYPSDQMNFPYGVGICALNKSKAGLYLGRIHTSRDTILDPTNVNLLRAALTTFLCRDAVK